MKSNRRLVLLAVFSICVLALSGVIPGANANAITSGPVINPCLASSVNAITHFDPSQSDSTPYGPPRGFFTVDPAKQPVIYGGPINIITLASTDRNHMWAVGSNRVSYVNTNGSSLREVAKFEALANATGNVVPAIPDDSFRTFGGSSAVGMNVSTMDSYLKSLFGDNYQKRGGHGAYSVVDNNNVLYTNYGDNLYAFALSDPADPSAGITVRYKIEHIVATIEGNDPAPPTGTRIVGLSMTYDGHIILTLSNGVAVLDRNLDNSSFSFYRFPDSEFVSNSVAVDEHNGIYIASNSIMRKLIWTGSTLSANVSGGAWSSPYDHSVEKPPIISFSNGTGSTPTLMGFGDDPDKLVVITDGASQMKLVAFWRDNIPEGFVQKPGTQSRRIAGQIQVTCGYTALPEYIQSEQSVVVDGYGAFVVNNIPATVDPELKNKNMNLQASLMGPAYPASFGVERFEWNPGTHEWSSVWGRPDVSSTSMIPVHSKSGNMALINGYREPNGWEVLGLDWDSGVIVHQTIFGRDNFGNGAYAILEYLDNGDLLFNSIVGPIRIHYESGSGPTLQPTITPPTTQPTIVPPTLRPTIPFATTVPITIKNPTPAPTILFITPFPITIPTTFPMPTITAGTPAPTITPPVWHDAKNRIGSDSTGSFPGSIALPLMTFTGKDNGRTVGLDTNNIVAVSLDENPSTGFTWVMTNTQGIEILKDSFVVSGPSIPSQTPVTGCGGTRTWTLKLTGTGNQTFQGVYKQPWMPVADSAATFAMFFKVS
jgi:predicted secreted protein